MGKKKKKTVVIGRQASVAMWSQIQIPYLLNPIESSISIILGLLVCLFLFSSVLFGVITSIQTSFGKSCFLRNTCKDATLSRCCTRLEHNHESTFEQLLPLATGCDVWGKTRQKQKLDYASRKDLLLFLC